MCSSDLERRNLTSAVTTVTSKDFLQGAANNPLQMIDGKIPGVTISNYAISDPNRNPMDNFQVRGSMSFKGGSAPLVVVDGMPGADLKQIAKSRYQIYYRTKRRFSRSDLRITCSKWCLADYDQKEELEIV